MDTPIENLPFKITFITYHSINSEVKKRKTLGKYSFKNQLSFIEDLDLYEYDSLSVCFSSNTRETVNGRLYMDCFEFLDGIEGNVLFDEGGFEYLPLNEEVFIHRHFHNDVGTPLIPGVYKIKVVYEDMIYYSQIIIKPNNLGIAEHKLMINEIESHAKGLARDWIRKKASYDFLKDTVNLDPTFIDYAVLLLKHQSIIKKSMTVILENPYADLEKEYLLTSMNKGKKLDAKSLKMSQMKNSASLYNLRSQSDSEIFSYIYKNKLDNNVNYSLKKVIIECIQTLDFAKRDINKLKIYLSNDLHNLKRYKKINNHGEALKISSREKQLNEVIKLEEASNNLYKSFRGFVSNSFLKKIKVPNRLTLSQQFIKSPGYNNFHKLHKIMKNNLHYNINDLFEYNWKSSESLYEYWCFIKIIEILIGLDFKPHSGWIYNTNDNSEYISIPEIPDNTSIDFINDELRLVLIFNSEIEKKRENASRKRLPYWTRSLRNKPDFRLDIYKNNVFIKTIILDSKYSPAHRIWNKSTAHSSKSKVVEQLKMYVNMVIKVDEKNTHVVEEVIALCPTPVNKDCYIDVDSDHLVTIATLKPGFENDDLKQRLDCIIFEK